MTESDMGEPAPVSAREKVSHALRSQCHSEPRGYLFVTYYPATFIAKKANVSPSTVHRIMRELLRCRGYRRRIIGGVIGYRYDRTGTHEI